MPQCTKVNFMHSGPGHHIVFPGTCATCSKLPGGVCSCLAFNRTKKNPVYSNFDSHAVQLMLRYF